MGVPTSVGVLYLAAVPGGSANNAFCGSFFPMLESELIDRRRFRSRAEARLAIFAFLQAWYNPRQRRPALGYLLPIDYEGRVQPTACPQPAAVHENGSSSVPRSAGTGRHGCSWNGRSVEGLSNGCRAPAPKSPLLVGACKAMTMPGVSEGNPDPRNGWPKRAFTSA